MKTRTDRLIPIHDDEDTQSTSIVKREPTEEERVFQQFCNCVDAHLVWKGLLPIASSEKERREKAMLYLLKSIEAYRWFAELVGGLDMLEKLLGGNVKSTEITVPSAETKMAARKKPRFVVRM